MTRILEDDLQALLRARADDIDAVPERVLAFAAAASPAVGDVRLSELDERRRRRTHARPQHRVPWLVAAAVVLVLVAAGVYAVLARPGSPTQPVNTPTVTRPTPSPTPTAPEPTASAALRWSLGITLPRGFDLAYRTLTPDFQLLGLSPSSAADCAGCPHPLSVYVKVYRAGAFDPRTVQDRSATTVDGHAGYRGIADAGSFDGVTPISDDPLTTLAWQYRPGAWAAVYARTAAASTPARLLVVARALHIGQGTPMRTPVRLGYVPKGLVVVSAAQDLKNPQYGTTIIVGDRRRFDPDKGSYLTIQARTATGADQDQPRHIAVGGHTAVVDPSGLGAYLRIGSVRVEIAASGAAFGRTVATRVLTGLVVPSTVTADPATWLDARTLLP